MKKITLLLCASMFMFMSCPNDDDVNPQPEDQIIGTWKYYMYLENDVEEELELCETEEILIFYSDGAFNGSYYEEFSGICELEGTTEGTWTNSSNGNYTVTVDEEMSTVAITFEGNTFYFEETYVDGTTTIVSREVYIRQ